VYISGALVGAGLVSGSDQIIRAGISVLITTPLLNVAILGGGYALEKRWRWAATSLLILAAIAISAALGIRH